MFLVNYTNLYVYRYFISQEFNLTGMHKKFLYSILNEACVIKEGILNKL